jgi:hypothetical protein
VRIVSPNKSTLSIRASSDSESRSTRARGRPSAIVSHKTGVAVYQTATASAAPRCPVAIAFANATDSGSAGQMPG